MKRAVIYTRVSTDDQKEFGFSLQDQEARLTKYCKQKNYQIIRHYQDDHSAKNFNRPAFKEFLKELKEKKVTPDIFLCVRMDRFSRNAADSLNMLKDFQKWGIYFECIENHIDVSTPESLIPYMLNLVLPEVENKRRGINTKRGLRQGLKEGRWMWKAPVGYLNDVVNKLVIPNKENAHLVTWAFETYAQGIYNANEVRLKANERGLLISKQKFYDMLINPFYMGKIKIPAFEDEKETIINGNHTPLIGEETFYKVQEILHGKKKPYQGKTNPEHLPLKGHLVCPKCGNKMTGSGSRGNGGVYHYYHCQRLYGCSNSFPASDANQKFIQFLKSFDVPDEILTLYYNILEDVFKSNEYEKEAEKTVLEKDIDNITKKINSLNDKFIDDLISASDYKEMKSILESRKNELINKHFTIMKMDKEFSKYTSYGLSLLGNLSNYYENASPDVKSKIIGSIFPGKLIFDEDTYRTNEMNEVFRLISSTSKLFRKQKANKNVGLSSLAPPSGLEPETL